jgi:hypothetical protein
MLHACATRFVTVVFYEKFLSKHALLIEQKFLHISTCTRGGDDIAVSKGTWHAAICKAHVQAGLNYAKTNGNDTNTNGR